MNVPYTVLPRDIDLPLAAIPSSATDIVANNTVDMEIAMITVVNAAGASDVTFTVQDNATVPFKLLDAVTISANLPNIFIWDPPVLMSGGAKWACSTTGMTGTLRGRRKGGYAISGSTPA